MSAMTREEILAAVREVRSLSGADMHEEAEDVEGTVSFNGGPEVRVCEYASIADAATAAMDAEEMTHERERKPA